MHTQPHTAIGFSRRDFLRVTVGLSATAVASACSPSPGAPTGANATVAPGAGPPAASGKPVTLPTYQPPPNMPAPDFPGSADGVVMPGYVNWPKTSFQSVKQAPGDGSEISIYLDLQGGPPPPVDQDPAWQAWNKALNA